MISTLPLARALIDMSIAHSLLSIPVLHSLHNLCISISTRLPIDPATLWQYRHRVIVAHAAPNSSALDRTTTLAMALSSDHVNYLILRYLQEAGHENAATAFYRDWHRQPEFRDPENYPFARVVRRGELVRVIQDGLHLDEVTARVRKNERRFQFTAEQSREALERREREGLENGAMGSRPGSSAKRKARPMAMRPPDEFPTPAPKRQRRSEGSEGVHLNGDAMDVDAVSASADAEDDNEAPSPAVASETDVVEVPERYDSMDVGVQTDIKTGPKTTTMSWKLDRPEMTIYDTIFNPNADPHNSHTLLAVGESLCRFYTLPDSMDDSLQMCSLDEPKLPPNTVVSASAWHPDGHIAFCAIDTRRHLSDGQHTSETKLLTHYCDTGTSLELLCPPLLEPAEVIIRLRCSPTGRYLLAIRTNTKRGLALVYDIAEGNHEPIAWVVAEQMIMDGVWFAEDFFVVCGEMGLVESYKLDPESLATEHNFTQANPISLIGLKTTSGSVVEHDTQPKWEKVSYDGTAKVFALAAMDPRRLALQPWRGEDEHNQWMSWSNEGIELPAELTALAFRPSSTADAKSPLLATTFEDGNCRLYTIRNDAESCVLTLRVSLGPALALAWSHDGQYLAVGGTDSVQIWDVDPIVEVDQESGSWTESSNASLSPLITWRSDANTVPPKNGEHDDHERVDQPSLSWSADGERLGFAIDKLVSELYHLSLCFTRLTPAYRSR
jgi:WD40 repeat protein